MSPSTIWRDLLLCGLVSVSVVGAVATIQTWEMFKPPIRPIPVNPPHIELPKEMLVNYEHVFIGWEDPDVWMLRPDPANGTWDRMERSTIPREVRKKR